MGIPGLARQIIKNNKSHLWDKNMKFHYLFFDYRALIVFVLLIFYKCLRSWEPI